jgi:hypothetical protein
MRFFRRFSAIHVDGIIGSGAVRVPVIPPSIALVLAQSALSVNRGASVDVVLTLTRVGTTAAVALAASGPNGTALPAGVTASFSPASLTGATLTSTLTLTAAAGAAVVDDAPIEVTATAAGVTPVVLEATLDVNAVPSTGIPAILIKAMRHDGLTGNAQPASFIPCKPGVVKPTDIQNITVWDVNGAQVGCFPDDIGARHLAANVANGLLGFHLQLNTSFATPGSEPAFTVKFDQPVTAASRISAQPYTEWTQTLDVQIAAAPNAFKLRLNSDCTVHPYDSDAPLRVLAQDITWASTTTPTIPATGYAVVGVRLMVRTTTGQVFAYPKKGATRTALGNAAPSISNVDYWFHNYGGSENVVGETCIGFVAIHIAAGTAAPTIGTADLTGAGITVTTTGSGKEPFSTLPTEMPVASLAPSDPVYCSATEFQGHKLTPMGSDTDTVLVAARSKGSDWTWGRLGWYTYLTNGGSTWYNSILEEWSLYARGYGSRFYRRALATQKAFRYLAQITAGGYKKLPEAGADGAQPLVYYALTQRPFDTLNTAAAVEVQAARDVLYRNESAEYNGHTLNGQAMYGTGRFGMHVIQQTRWFAVLGVDPGPGYPVIPANDGELWPNATAWANVATAYEHFARMCDRMHTSTVAAAASPGLRYLAQPNGDDFLVFMEGWTWSYMALALRCFGVPEKYPGGPLSDATDGIVKDMNDSIEYAFSGVSKWTGEPLYVTRGNGGTAFTYCMPGGVIIDGADVTTRTTLATGMTAYNDATLFLTNAAPFPTPATGGSTRIRLGDPGTTPTVYDYTGKSGNTLTGVTYVGGPHTASAANVRVQGHVNGPNSTYVGTNGTWLMALAYQYQTLPGAAKTTAKARGDALRLGQHDTTPNPAWLADTRLSTWNWPKELPEVDLVGSCWEAETV